MAFAVYRDDSFADFSRGFGEELLEPGSEIRTTWRGDDGQLVATVVRRGSEDGSQYQARMSAVGTVAPQA